MNTQPEPIPDPATCRERALQFIHISDELHDLHPGLAMFALNRAIDNYQTAQMQEEQTHETP